MEGKMMQLKQKNSRAERKLNFLEAGNFWGQNCWAFMKSMLRIYSIAIVLAYITAASSFAAAITPASYTYIKAPYPDTSTGWVDTGNVELTNGVTGSFTNIFPLAPRVGFNQRYFDVIFDFGEAIKFTSVSSDTWYSGIYSIYPSVKRHVAVSNSLEGPWEYTITSFAPPSNNSGKINTSAFTGTGRYLRVREYTDIGDWMTVSEFSFIGDTLPTNILSPVSYNYVTNPYPDTSTGWVDPGKVELKDGVTASFTSLFPLAPRVGFNLNYYDVIFDFGQSVNSSSLTSDTWRYDVYSISPATTRMIAASEDPNPAGTWTYSNFSLSTPNNGTGKNNTSVFNKYGRYLRLKETSAGPWMTVSEVKIEGYRFPNIYLHQLRYQNALLLGATWPTGISSKYPSSISLTITQGGTTVLSTSVPVADAFKGAVIPVSLSSGTYHVSVLTTVDGQSVYSLDRDILYTSTPANPIVKFNADGVCLNNGTAFFPLGIYHAKSVDLQSVANAGFNVTMPQQATPTPPSWGRNDDGNDYVGKCTTAGIKAMGIGGGYLSPGNTDGQALLEYYRDNPNLAFWYVRDEPARSQLADMYTYYEQGVNWDPTHPFFILQNTPDNEVPDIVNYYALTSQYGDVFGVDPYPIYSNSCAPFKTVAETVNKAVTSVFGKKPVWAAIQSYSLVDSSDGSYHPRLPTADELSCMSYLALAAGARGLLYYAFDDSYYISGTLHGINLRDDTPAYWASLIALVSELRTNTAIWTAPYATDSPVNETPNVVVQNKPYVLNNYVYILVVNPESTANSVRVWLPYKWSSNTSAVDILGGTSGTVSHSILTDQLAPMETKCYKLLIQ